MSRPLTLLAISIALLGASCAGESPKPKLDPRPFDPRPIAAPPPAPASVARAIDVERPPDSYRGFPVSLPPLLSPELGPYYERLAAKLDPQSWYLWLEQTPPRGFRGLRKQGAFPGGPYAVIRAYESGLAGLYPGPPLFAWPERRCVGALASDGTLCPSTVAPGTTLSATQARELIAIVNEVDRVDFSGVKLSSACSFPKTASSTGTCNVNASSTAATPKPVTCRPRREFRSTCHSIGPRPSNASGSACGSSSCS